MASYRISTAGVDEGGRHRRGAGGTPAAAVDAGAGSHSNKRVSGYNSNRSSGVYTQPVLESPIKDKQRAQILQAELAVPASERPVSSASPVRLLAVRPLGLSTEEAGAFDDKNRSKTHRQSNKGLFIDNLPESSVDPDTPPPRKRREGRRDSSSSSSRSSSSSSSGSRSCSSRRSSLSLSPRIEMEGDGAGAQAPQATVDLSGAAGEVVIIQDSQSEGKTRKQLAIDFALGSNPLNMHLSYCMCLVIKFHVILQHRSFCFRFSFCYNTLKY